MLFKFIILTCSLTITYAANKLIALPLSLTSRLESNFYRDTKQPFSFTNLTDVGSEQEELLLSSQQASFISYSSEFTSIVGLEPELKLIESRATSIPFAHEGGAYIPETNEVWFTANQLPQQNTNVSSVNLTTNQVQLLSIQPPIITPNGVNYFNGSVYVCSQGNKNTPAAIYAVNPITLVSKLVVNSWFGFRLNSPNDVTFSTKIAEKTFMWFTDPPVAYMQNFSTVPQIGSYVFRYDMLTSELRPVISDLIIPNGIAFDQNETTLYITDTSPDTGVHIVYAYDLNADVLPISRRVFSVSSYGIPDGIKIDKNNRVWTGEGDGLNVRDRHGTLLGVILGRNLCDNGVISNFALVKNTVIILAQEKLWRLDLATDVILKRIFSKKNVMK
jgi:gluconolactonase